MRRLVVALGVVAALLACDDVTETTRDKRIAWAIGDRSSAENLLLNPSFESEREPWYAMLDRPYWANFVRSRERARSGEWAAKLELTSRGFSRAERIYGAIQDVSATELPHWLSGWFRVDRWQRGAAKQYIQAVVAIGNPEAPLVIPPPPAPNLQLAYVLGGIEEAPFPIANRRFQFAGTGDVQLGEWIPFEFDLREDFLREYGYVPRSVEWLRVFFEVRYDERNPAEDLEAYAEVYFDDLYLGSTPPSQRGHLSATRD